MKVTFFLINEMLRKPLLHIANKLLGRQHLNFDQLTPPEQKLWSDFENSDIYKFLTGQKDTVPEFKNFLTFAANPSMKINTQNIAQTLQPIHNHQQVHIQRTLSAPSPVTHFLRERKTKVDYKAIHLGQQIKHDLQQVAQEAKGKCKAMRKAGPRHFFTKAANPCFRTFIASYYVFFILELLALKMNGAMAVPDPEPRLIDANAAEPAKLQLLFRPSEKYAASTHFIHVRVPFNFSKLLETPAQILNHYQSYIDKWPEPFRTQVDEVADISKSCLADKLNDFTNILVALLEYEVITRDKRFLDLVSFGMSAAVLTLATFNTAKISHLETQITHNNK
jgi:hypothetical protein